MNKGNESLRELGLTLMYPCFGQEKRIFKLLKVWDEWSDDVKDHVQINLIDDHGTPSVEEILSNKTMDYNISVYRIQDDLKYNIAGALNLGMMLADTPWILTMDTDYSFQPDVMQSLLDFRPNRYEVYGFFLDRAIPHEIPERNVHTTTFLLHKDTFIDLNGFDEDLTGNWSNKLQPRLRELGLLDPKFPEDVQGYGYEDNSFLYRLQHEGYEYVLPHGYLATEWIDDTADEHKEYAAINRKLCRCIFNAKKRGELPESTDMLRFKWKRVIHNLRGNK